MSERTGKFLTSIGKAVPAELDVHVNLRQPRHPQEPAGPAMARGAVPRAFHPGWIVVTSRSEKQRRPWPDAPLHRQPMISSSGELCHSHYLESH
jgi:hypothetical protein